MTQVADAVGDPSGVGYAGDGDAFAREGDGAVRTVEVLDRHLDLGAGVALERRRDLLGGESFGLLAVDGQNPVADPQPSAVGR